MQAYSMIPLLELNNPFRQAGSNGFHILVVGTAQLYHAQRFYTPGKERHLKKVPQAEDALTAEMVGLWKD
jgi:hypothetical protein